MPPKDRKSIPEYLFDEVHPIKNGNKKLENYSGGSSVKFWWICNKNDCEH